MSQPVQISNIFHNSQHPEGNVPARTNLETILMLREQGVYNNALVDLVDSCRVIESYDLTFLSFTFLIVTESIQNQSEIL